MHASGRVLATWPTGHNLALGGGGLAHWLIRLFIWHAIWRLLRYLWHIHTFGPYIVIALVLVIAGLVIWRQSRGSVRLRRSRNSGPAGDDRDSGTGTGPRDW